MQRKRRRTPELAMSPAPPAVREPLAIRHHEINVREGAGHPRLTRFRIVLWIWFQWIFAILAPSGNGFLAPLPGMPDW